MLVAWHPLAAYHAHLQLLDALAGDCVAWSDLSACWVHEADMLHAFARSQAPPQPVFLFSQHYVGEPTTEESPVWIHTHGLHRCGVSELDAVDVSAKHVSEASQLMNTAAMRFIDERALPEEGERSECSASSVRSTSTWPSRSRTIQRSSPSSRP